MRGKNFLNSDRFNWNDDGVSTVCDDAGHRLFTIFNDTRNNELINAFNAGLQMGMSVGRDQKAIEFLRASMS